MTDHLLEHNAARMADAVRKADDVIWLVERGEEPHRAARRVGTSLAQVRKTLERYDRLSDWMVISRALPLSVHPSRKARP